MPRTVVSPSISLSTIWTTTTSASFRQQAFHAPPTSYFVSKSLFKSAFLKHDPIGNKSLSQNSCRLHQTSLKAKSNLDEDITESEEVSDARQFVAPPSTLFNINLTRLLIRQLGIGGFFLLCNPSQVNGLFSQWNGELGLGMASFGLVFFGVPLALVGEWMQRQSDPVINKINQSTNLGIMQIFGTKRQTVEVGMVAAALSLWVAVSEEVCYRGAVLPSLANNFESVPLGLLSSSVLFGIAHWGGDRTKEGALLVALQTFYGLMFGGACLLSGGGLVAPVAAHFLYDFWTFMGTHLLVTGQVEYSMSKMRSYEPDSLDVAEVVAKLKRKYRLKDRFVNLTRSVFLWIDTNKNGFLDVNELRVALCAFGQKPSEADAQLALESADTDQNLMLDFGEFLELVIRIKGDPEIAIKGLMYG
mmetsp:Transcript_22507/g.31318  ORF Transcript_22507/g.31318 Transcript_22507/m.31318 type:complete len:417 (+) Transcript_22507:227-1477(+)